MLAIPARSSRYLVAVAAAYRRIAQTRTKRAAEQVVKQFALDQRGEHRDVVLRVEQLGEAAGSVGNAGGERRHGEGAGDGRFAARQCR
jgi:NADH dehydrogenase/NADH:ubiquinone oxidoreductase subunit G